jgi:hypothetical protein
MSKESGLLTMVLHQEILTDDQVLIVPTMYLLYHEPQDIYGKLYHIDVWLRIEIVQGRVSFYSDSMLRIAPHQILRICGRQLCSENPAS